MSNLKPFAFVLMPFAKEFDDLYKLGVQAVATEMGIVAERVDEQFYSESMLDRIYRQIELADFIVADMTGKNPNVFYEVGYAHAKGKLCTLLTSNSNDIPFDLKHHRHLVYGDSIQRLRELLAAEFSWLKNEVEKRKTSVVTIKIKHALGTLVKEEDWWDKAHLDLCIDIHNDTERRTPDIEAMYIYTSTAWDLYQSNEHCAHTVSDLLDYKKRHFINLPVSRLSPGAWAQIKIEGKSTLWSRFKGGERKEKYKVIGRLLCELVTAEGNIRQVLNLDVEFSELPF